jgi:hypothetical protein
MTTYLQDKDGENHHPDDCTKLFVLYRGNYCLDGYLLNHGVYADILNVEEVTCYDIFNETYEDEDDAEKALASAFWEMIEDPRQLLDDAPMRNEAFSAWTDGLNRDNHICDDSFKDLGLNYGPDGRSLED